MKLPERPESRLGELPYTCDNIGKSGPEVRLYEDMVLKIEPKQARPY